MEKQGQGWKFVERSDRVELRFNSKPDVKTIQQLKQAGMSYDPRRRLWWAYAKPGSLICRDVLKIAEQAVTWESVGEDPPSPFSDDDYPIFHDY